MGPVEIARAIVRQVTFERKQSEEQPTIQVNPQCLGPRAPRRKCRVTLIHPVDQVPSDEAIALLFHPSPDCGRMEIVGLDRIRVTGKQVGDVRREPTRAHHETVLLEARGQRVE